MVEFSIDTAERAYTPRYAFGMLNFTIPDEGALEYIKAVQDLGFTVHNLRSN